MNRIGNTWLVCLRSFQRKGMVKLSVKDDQAVMNSRLLPHRPETVQMPQHADGSPDLSTQEHTN